MRLLNAHTLELREFIGDQIPPYAILSHTWGEEGVEVTFHDIQQPDRGKEKLGFRKLEKCCAQAVKDLLNWVWIDTCCIDKSSSAELSEAINSMYSWYEKAEVCYAYLIDVPPLDPVLIEKKFRNARWFQRGWCLQELIAPRVVEFYAWDWTEVGTKRSLESLIVKITGIFPIVLRDASIGLKGCNVAERMSWAAHRKTTREEDAAYCLLGIFGINMPLLYGEGSRAFVRLQEEILKQIEDYTLFLWRSPGINNFGGLLASSPDMFPGKVKLQGSQKIPYHEIEKFAPGSRNVMFPKSTNRSLKPPMVTSRGIQLTVFTKELEGEYLGRLIWLFSFCIQKQSRSLLCIYIGSRQRRKDVNRYEEPTYYRDQARDIVAIPPDELAQFKLKELYVAIKAPSDLPPERLWFSPASFTIRCVGAFRVLSLYPKHDFSFDQEKYLVKLEDIWNDERISVLFGRDPNDASKFAVVVQANKKAGSCYVVENATRDSISDLHSKSVLENNSDRCSLTMSNGVVVRVSIKVRNSHLILDVRCLTSEVAKRHPG